MARSLAGTISCGRTTTRTAARPSWRALVKLCARHGILAPFAATCHHMSSCRCEAASWFYAECMISSSPQLCGRTRCTSSTMFASHREAVSRFWCSGESRVLPLCSKPQNSECAAARQALAPHSHTNHAVNKQHSTFFVAAGSHRPERAAIHGGRGSGPDSVPRVAPQRAARGPHRRRPQGALHHHRVLPGASSSARMETAAEDHAHMP